MIDRRKSPTAWLFAKESLLTPVVPGTVVVLVPYPGGSRIDRD